MEPRRRQTELDRLLGSGGQAVCTSAAVKAPRIESIRTIPTQRPDFSSKDMSNFFVTFAGHAPCVMWLTLVRGLFQRVY